MPPLEHCVGTVNSLQALPRLTLGRVHYHRFLSRYHNLPSPPRLWVEMIE